MERLRKNHSIQVVDEALRYLSIQLRAEPVTRHYAMQLEQARKKLTELESEYEKAHEERLALTKQILLLDKSLGRVVMTLSLETLALTQNNRKDPRFKKLFSQAPSKINTPIAGAQKLSHVRSIMETLSSSDDLAAVRKNLQPIGDALGAVEQAVARRKELEAPEKKAMAARDATKMNAIKLYNMMYARLQILFEDDTPKVNSFFADLRR